MSTDPAELLDRLVEDDVLEETDEDALSYTEAFERHRRTWRERVGEMDDPEFRTEAERFDAATDGPGREAVADAVAILEFAGYDPDDALSIAAALERLETTLAESGVPEGFVHLDCAEIAPFVSENRAAVVYWWGRDSDACDLVRVDFEQLLEADAIDDEVALGAVYAADCPDELLERYQIGLVPTVLFFFDGRIDTRLVGAQPTETLEHEVGVIAGYL